MSEDQFKKFVDKNRGEFESYSQDFQEMWGGIEKGLEPANGVNWPGWIKMAAVVTLVAVTGWVALKFQAQGQLPLEIHETEQHYYNIISAKMEQVSVHEDQVDELIWEDLDLLDRAYADLKHDLKEKVDQEEVAQAMIENQRAKLEILNKVLDEIENKTDDEVETLDI